ncbi:MAG TPA: ABC transporter permease subunit [Micromonosporaceae bacterium]|nr:ABC transporter permease subunit [Micromonosporaceae bacterium]
MSLARAEARRLAKRRVTRYTLLLMVLGLAAIAVSFALTSQKIGPEQLAAARAEATRGEDLARQQADAERADCERVKESGGGGDRFPPGFDCAQITGPPPGTYQAEWYLPYQFDFRKEFSIFIAVFCGILALFAFIVGASFVGAEWSSGGMMNLLLWRPKRLGVLFTKLGVLLGAVLGIGLALGVVWTVAFWLIGRYSGRLGELTPGAWQSFALDGARGLGLVLAVAAVSFGLASIGRHTALALGAAVAVGVASEIGIRIAMSVAGVSFGDRFVLSTYAVSWFMKRYELIDWSSCDFVQGACEPDKLLVTWQDSALVFGVGTALVLVVAAWMMRSRDIT